MGALGAGMGGIVGGLNGVIQAPAGTSSPLTTGMTLPVNRCVLTAAGAVGRLVQSQISSGENEINEFIARFLVFPRAYVSDCSSSPSSKTR